MGRRRRNSTPQVMTRRKFNFQFSAAGAGFALGGLPPAPQETPSQVFLAKSSDRKSALRTVIQSLGEIDCQGKDVYLKASYNSSDPYPASTHPESLVEVAEFLRNANCRRIFLVERSGMGRSRDIWRRLRIPELASRSGISLLPLEELPANEWKKAELPDSHWKQGVLVPVFLNADAFVVSLCNLKTHRFGGHFSASLKNSIGLVAKYSAGIPSHNFMEELHSSPSQRLMIAEVNQVYRPSIIIMDAAEVFIDGGPEKGELSAAGTFAAARDRVALDAVGVALLKALGAGPPLAGSTVFAQDQIRRSAELQLGAKSAAEIQIVTSDSASAGLARQIHAIISQDEEEKKPK